jgi:site-specific recombinase XerD
VSSDRSDLPAVVKHGAAVTAPTLSSALAVPAMIAEAGDRAARRFLEFLAATIENDNTRMAYYRVACSFFAWLEEHGIGELPDIEPFHVAAYLKALRVSDAGDRAVKERTASRPTVKQHLAAIRMLFDWLVVGQILAINPAHAVRGPKHVVKRGKTPVLTEEQARQLLASITVVRKATLSDGSKSEVPWLVGLRDRALIGVMVYSFARISAVVAMEVDDYFAHGKRWWLRLHEKGGKRHEMPAHHKLEQFLDEYLDAASIRDSGKTPLFRSAAGKTGMLTDRPMHRVDAYQMRWAQGPTVEARRRLCRRATRARSPGCGAPNKCWRGRRAQLRSNRTGSRPPPPMPPTRRQPTSVPPLLPRKGTAPALRASGFREAEVGARATDRNRQRSPVHRLLGFSTSQALAWG